jgi:hypothetical protein
MRTGARRRTGDYMPNIVLVPRAYATQIGELREFKIQHRKANCADRDLRGPIAGDGQFPISNSY